MPDFYFDHYKIEDHLLSIPTIKVKKAYITFLMNKLSLTYEYYVKGHSKYPHLGERYLKTAFHKSNLIYPTRNGVEKYRVYMALRSLNRLVDSWIEFQKEYELTDEELFQSAHVYEEEIPETTANEKTEIALRFPCWNDYNRPELIKALNSLFNSYADISNHKINFRSNRGMITETALHNNAIGYFLYKLGPYVDLSMKKFVEDFVAINGNDAPSYDQLTKHAQSCGQKVKEKTDSMFSLENTFAN